MSKYPKWAGLFAFVVALTLSGARIEAQQPKKPARLGFLTGNTAAAMSNRVDAVRRELQQLGYREKQNMIIEYRYGEGTTEHLKQLAAELVQLKPDVIVTGGSQATRAIKETTSTVPIVMAQDNDPVGNGFVASLAKPGGNITGLSDLTPDICGKQLEILKEMLPRFSRLAVVGDASVPGNAQLLGQARLAAAAISVQVEYFEVRTREDIQPVFGNAANGHADAVLVLPGAILGAQRKLVADLALKQRLPSTYLRPEYVEDGGLMTYSANSIDLFRRAAHYVNKILKGAKPADLPVELPKKFEFIINLKTAKQIGLTIPPNVLARADKVIK